MNPRLVKFSVELQNSSKVEEKEKSIYFGSIKDLFKMTNPVKVFVNISRNKQ